MLRTTATNRRRSFNKLPKNSDITIKKTKTRPYITLKKLPGCQGIDIFYRYQDPKFNGILNGATQSSYLQRISHTQGGYLTMTHHSFNEIYFRI